MSPSHMRCLLKYKKRLHLLEGEGVKWLVCGTTGGDNLPRLEVNKVEISSDGA